MNKAKFVSSVIFLLVAAPSLTTAAPFTLSADIDCNLEQLLLSSGDSKQVSVEENGIAADVVFRGLSTSVVCAAPEDLLATSRPAGAKERENRSDAGVDDNKIVVDDAAGRDMQFTAFFELINTYKGANELNLWDPYNYRRVNVSLTPGPQGLSRCYSNARGVLSSTPVEYIVFCKVESRSGEVAGNRRHLRLVTVAPWDTCADERLWMALGWSSWSDWSSCSVSCSTGMQQRFRHCRLRTCPGFNIEQRHCNLFSCVKSISPLTHAHIDYFHPSRERWAQVTGRPNAFHLTPNSYIWLPSINLLEDPKPKIKQEEQLKEPNITVVGVVNEEETRMVFPREFALFVTLRVQNNSYGTIFSLRSRRRQDTYLSLEADGSDVKVIHASKNGTEVIRVPAKLNDGNWHQIAVSIRDDSVIDSYVDCQWSRTDVLRKGSLDIPNDSDLIIGYLFEGDLEQLTIVPDPAVVSLQCSNDITPIVDTSGQDFRSDMPWTRSPPTAATVNVIEMTVTVRKMASGGGGDYVDSNTIASDDLGDI